MPDEMRLAIVVDSTGARRGAGESVRSLDDIRRAARGATSAVDDTDRAMTRAGQSAGRARDAKGRYAKSLAEIREQARGAAADVGRTASSFDALQRAINAIAGRAGLGQVTSDLELMGSGLSVARAGLLGLGAGLATVGAAAGVFATRLEGSLDSALREVASILPETVEELGGLRTQLIDLSQDVPVTPELLTKGHYQVLSSGITDTADALNVLGVSARAGVAGLTDTFTAADALTTVLNAYQMEAAEANRVSDVLFQTVNAGKINFPQLATNIGDVASEAALAGISIEEVGAGIATLTALGVRPAQSFTSLAGVIRTLSRQTDDQREAFKELGIDFNITGLQAYGFAGLLDQVRDATNGDTEALNRLFPDIEAARGAMVLAGSGAEMFAENLDKMAESAGSTQSAFDEMQGSLDNQWQMLKNNVNAAWLDLGERILPLVLGVLERINRAMGGAVGGMRDQAELLRRYGQSEAARRIDRDADRIELVEKQHAARERMRDAAGGIGQAWSASSGRRTTPSEVADLVGDLQFQDQMRQRHERDVAGIANLDPRNRILVDQEAKAWRDLDAAARDFVATTQAIQNLDRGVVSPGQVLPLDAITVFSGGRPRGGGGSGGAARDIVERGKVREALKDLWRDSIRWEDLIGSVGSVNLTPMGLGGSPSIREVPFGKEGTHAAEKVSEVLRDLGKRGDEASTPLRVLEVGLQDLSGALRGLPGPIADAVSGLANIAGGIEQFKAARGQGGIAGIVGQIAGVAGIASSVIQIGGSIGKLFGAGQSAWEQALDRNTETLERLRLDLSGFRLTFGAQADLARLAEQLSGKEGDILNRGGGFLGRATTERQQDYLERLAQQFGGSLEQLNAAADRLGIELYDDKGRVIRGALDQLAEALRMSALQVENFGKTLDGQWKLLDARADIFDVEDPAKLAQVQLDKLLGGLSERAEVDFGLTGLDLSSAGGRDALEAGIRKLFEAFEAGTLDPSMLAGFESVDQFLQALLGADNALDRLRETTDRLNESMINLPGGYRLGHAVWQNQDPHVLAPTPVGPRVDPVGPAPSVTVPIYLPDGAQAGELRLTPEQQREVWAVLLRGFADASRGDAAMAAIYSKLPVTAGAV